MQMCVLWQWYTLGVWRFRWCMESTLCHEGGAECPFFLECNSPLVSHLFADKLGHDHHSGKGWTWTHQPISHDTSADGSSSDACVPIRGVGGNDHECQSGASGWMSWATLSFNLTSLNHAGRNMTSTSSPDQLYPDSRWWEKLVSPHDSDKCRVFLWCWCGHPQTMPLWPLDSSSGIPYTTEDLGDATLWHSCVPRYRPLRQPTTR